MVHPPRQKRTHDRAAQSAEKEQIQTEEHAVRLEGSRICKAE